MRQKIRHSLFIIISSFKFFNFEEKPQNSPYNYDQTEITTDINENRDEKSSYLLRRDSRLYLPPIDTSSSSIDKLMSIGRLPIAEKLTKRDDRNSFSLDMTNFEKDEKEETTRDEKKASNYNYVNKRAAAQAKKTQDAGKTTNQSVSKEDKNDSQSQSKSQPQNNQQQQQQQQNIKKRTKESKISTIKLQITSDLKKKPGGGAGDSETDNDDVEKKIVDGSKKQKSNISKKVFKFGPIKDDLNVKSIQKSIGDTTTTPSKPKKVKKVKKEGKTKKKSVLIIKPEIASKIVDNNVQESEKKFGPLGQLNEEDFEGVDLNQLERMNLQVNF